ncbi:MAG TPA: acyl-CoA dehydrogenase family protein [Dehalococcoidia bacterium]
MVDLALSPEQDLLKTHVRSYLEDRCPKAFIRSIDESPESFDRAFWSETSELGWPATLIPEAYGGTGSSLMDAAVLFEELGWACIPSTVFSSAVLGALSIIASGSKEHAERLLPQIASGNKIVTVALTEPEHSWAFSSIKMGATANQNSYVLDGVKLFVPDAQVADTILVLARTAAGADGLTLFEVERDAPGVAVRKVTGWTGDRLNEVSFNSVSVSKSAVLGEAGAAGAFMEDALAKSILILSAYMVGGMQQMSDLSTEYSRNRIAFGVPISTFQRVQDMIITIVNDLESARWVTYESIWKMEQGFAPDQLSRAVSMTKAVASEGFASATEQAHYVHGGVSVDKGYGLYLYTKKSRSLYNYLGSPQYHRKLMARTFGLGAA